MTTRKRTFAVSAILAIAVFAAIAAASGGAKKTVVHGIGWHTNLADAQVEAKRLNRPILLLSMFGKLDEDMPCANARTLRATLFKDPGFKQLATDEVVLAWEMVRPVPKVEIDLGNGKKLVRTVRGNAVMYLLNTDGKVVDAFPGVYTAADFIPALHTSVKSLAYAKPADVIAYHKERGAVPPPTRTTMGKMAVESPTLRLVGAEPISGPRTTISPEDSAERKLFLTAAARLSDGSLTPMAPEETIRAINIGKTTSAAERSKKIMERDSKTNLTRVRPVIHLWFASEKTLPTPGQARDAVLETILHIPYKDPYLGLRDVLLPGTDN